MAGLSALFALVLAGGAAAAFALLRPDPAPAPVTYMTSEATVGPLVEAVTATGTLQALVTVEVGKSLYSLCPPGQFDAR